MPVQTLEEWYGRVPSSPLSFLQHAAVGIDASYYLDLHLNKQSQEQLLNALGGAPFVLKATVEREIGILRSHDITPVFVFNGLEFGGMKRESAGSSSESAAAYEKAWAAYDGGNVDEVLKWFQRAGNSAEANYKLLQKICIEKNVDFIVAPYGATAQLACALKEPVTGEETLIHAVMGPPDIFLFDVEKTILRIDFEAASFEWLSKLSCQDKLDRVPNDTFRDALLLTGTPFLPIFPPVQRNAHGSKKMSIRDTLNMLNNVGRSVPALCNSYREDPEIQSLQYADRYKKAVMTINHHVIMETSGKVSPLDLQHAPGDVHEFIGQRLPEELYFYISRGILSPDVPIWLTSGVIDVSLPPGTADSDAYRRLMREQLLPVWTQSLSLLSTSLHRYYQTRSVSLKTYFGTTNEGQINLKEVPSVKEQLGRWKVHENLLPKPIKALTEGQNVTFLAALKSLNDSSFVSQSLSTADAKEALSTKSEIASNSLWRFLQLRGYVSSETHQITAWGSALEAALSKLDPADKLEDAVVLGIELIRLGLVNDSDMFGGVSGFPHGDDSHKQPASLISRVACFGRLKHKTLGYSGPLSRQFLTYAGLIGAVRVSLSNLLEVVMVGLFLGAEVSRDREDQDWFDLGISLPLIDDNGCGLGVLAKTYFDQIWANAQTESPTLGEHSAQAKKQCSEYFKNIPSFTKNLDLAFRLWDAVYAGVKAAGKEVKDRETWDEADAWLKARR